LSTRKIVLPARRSDAGAGAKKPGKKVLRTPIHGILMSWRWIPMVKYMDPAKMLFDCGRKVYGGSKVLVEV